MCSYGREFTRGLPKYEASSSGDCCKVPIPAVFVNPLDENEKKQLFKGPVPHWRWMRDPKGKIEYSRLRSAHWDYDFYAKRFSEGLALRQENNLGRPENASFVLEGYGPKEI